VKIVKDISIYREASKRYSLKALAFLSNIFSPKSIRMQLLASLWLGVGGSLLVVNLISARIENKKAIEVTVSHLGNVADDIAFITNEWTTNFSQTLHLLSSTESIKSLDSFKSNLIFNKLKSIFPYRHWRLWDQYGNLVASSAISVAPNAELMRNHKYFIDAMNGKESFSIRHNCLMNKPCFILNVPVYSEHQESSGLPRSKPIGVISSAVTLTDIEKNSHLDYFQDGLRTDLHEYFTAPATTSFQNKIYSGAEVFIVSPAGHVIFPVSKINDALSLKTPSELMKTEWASFIKLGIQNKRDIMGEEVVVSGHRYFVFTKRLSPTWNVVALADSATALKKVRAEMASKRMYQILGLLIFSVITYIIAGRFTEPLNVATNAIKKLSTGKLHLNIKTTRKDEIGDLFDNINSLSSNLVRLIKQEKESIVNQSQIKTASKIHQDFILKLLPNNSHIEISAAFLPAYELGADWYDALIIDDTTFFLIADVCDKGIPSALFMSVFRSLVRFACEDEYSALGSEKIEEVLLNTISRVNNYIAKTHADLAMFATVFMAAYSPKEDHIHYVSAGHEKLLIIKSVDQQDILYSSGPIVGIFPDAIYKVERANFQPGDILFGYSDGLVDARSPEGKAWGFQMLKDSLLGIEPKTTSAEQVMSQILEKVESHRDGAERFDDLTLLVVKAL
jgi:serine phosphatase RsbU (regulator of sigma subunit)